jgi:heme/copper-type cytochrome/quinol oxidase subunit 3
MACYSDAMKAKASKFVLIVSIAIFIFGVLTVAYAYTQSTGKTIETQYTTFKVDKSGFATMTLIGGIFAVIVAILGILTAKFKKFFLAIPFGVCAFIVALILLIAGAIAGGFDGKIQDLKVQACTTPI